MKKNVFFVILGSLVILSCNQGTKDNKSAESAEEIAVYEQLVLDSLLANAENYIDKNISFEGTVSHVCKDGGQKMYVFASSDDKSMKITVGENYSEFKIDLEGSTVKIDGILMEQRIDETYLAEWEAEINNPKEEEKPTEEEQIEEGEQHSDDHHATEKSHELTNADLEKIANLRAKIEASEKGYWSNFSVECVKFEVLEEVEEIEPAEETQE